MIPPQTLRSLTEQFQPQRGAPPILLTPNLIEAQVYHPLPAKGTLAEHLAELGGPAPRDASLAERRTHPDAFDRDLRLLGLDGVQFSLRNTEPIRAETTKARTRRGRAAFAKLGLCGISDLGLHNPVVAAVGLESERALARRCLLHLPRRWLLLGDRYYGVGCCIAECIPLCRERGSEYLFRVRANLKAEPVRLLADGSALVRVTLADGAPIEVRKIRGRIRPRAGARTVVRLWTSLLAARRHPARKLLRLYARRWEQEVASDELKNQLHRGALLQSQPVRTAVQELAALVLAQALVARVRTAAARRGRTYPRAVRQPVTEWPRLRHN